MRNYRFMFTPKEDAPVNDVSTIIDCSWQDIEQAKQSARAYLMMMRGSYRRVDIFEPVGTMWRASGEFIENTNNLI